MVRIHSRTADAGELTSQSDTGVGNMKHTAQGGTLGEEQVRTGWKMRVKALWRRSFESLDSALLVLETRAPAGVRQNLARYARGASAKSRRKLAALARSRKRITLARLSAGLVFLRWLAVIQLWASQRVGLVTFDPIWLVALALYAAIITVFSGEIHRHMQAGRWVGPVLLDAAWLFGIVIVTGGSSSPIYWILCVPCVSAGMYASGFRRRTTLTFGMVIVSGFVASSLLRSWAPSPAQVARLATQSAVVLLASGIGALVAVLGRSHSQVYDLRGQIAPVPKGAEPVDTVVQVVADGFQSLQRDSALLLRLVPPSVRIRVRNAIDLKKEDWPASSVLPLEPLPDDRCRTILGKLTHAQLEIVEMRADGMSIPEIAAARGVKSSTIEDHLRNISERIGIRESTDLALFAVVTCLKTSSQD